MLVICNFYPVVLRGSGARPVTRQMPKTAAQKYLPLYCYPCYSPTAASRPANFCPSKPPILTLKFSHVLHISQTYSSAIPPLFVSLVYIFVSFTTLSNVSRLLPNRTPFLTQKPRFTFSPLPNLLSQPARSLRIFFCLPLCRFT